ncbi:MAG: NAD(P)H-quinone oxidoreductase subunit F [Alkalinema sp. FL-bin-369]|nr:NAD(P)H-quinone oxidoreductase subunit F [Leptolyngbyaceae cyanobacterium LF-bin-369]
MPHSLIQSIWLLPIYTLVGAALSVIWFPGLTRRTGPRPAGYINAILSLFAFVHASIALSIGWDNPAYDFSVPWLQVANLNLAIPFHIDTTALAACTVITGINFLAQIFAIGYLELDWGWARFFSLLAFFEAGMNFLVLNDSLFFSYMALELLTLGTYLLLGLWFNQPLVVTGARDAFLTKRVGDLFLLMGVVALWPIAGTWNYSELAVWASSAQVDPKAMTLLGLALLAGPMGKCAQFPLHLWLDEAMEGPVPGTILRNSLVVQVGAWVLVKLYPVLALSQTVLNVAIGVGVITAVGGSLIAIAQIDIKRTLSYPTSVVMGCVFIAVGTGNIQAALLLSLSHALGMALMVMSSSAVVWNSVTQDITQLGGLFKRRPISAFSLAIGGLGVIAMPPFGGFWAFLQLLEGLRVEHPVISVVVILVNFLLAFGFSRVFCHVFLGPTNSFTERSPEVHYWMILPMVTVMGFVLHLPLIMGATQLLPTGSEFSLENAIILTWSTLSGLGFAAVAYLSPSVAKPIKLPSSKVQDLFAYDFYTPQLYRNTIIGLVSFTSTVLNSFDRFFIDGLANSFGLATLFSGQSLRYSTSGQSQFYMMTMVIGIIGIVGWLCYPFLNAG